jgi:hypothetical protein
VVAPILSHVPGDEAHRRQRKALLAGLAVLLVAGLGFIVWALQGGTDSPSAARGGPTVGSSVTGPDATTPSPSGSEPTTSSAGTSSPSTSAAPEATTTSNAAPGVRGSALARAVRDYYALLPDHIDAGWRRLTVRYRTTTARDRETYEQFWGSVDAVEVRRSEGTAPDQVVATIRYAFDDGRRFEERTSFRLADVGGVLKIDASSVLSSRQL